MAPSTVRFYERAGLISPARRAHNRYRMFSESALDEIMFVQRAKGIGMSLEDIADLVAAWPTGKCQSLQARLRAYVAGRISEVHKQQAELSQTTDAHPAAGDLLAKVFRLTASECSLPRVRRWREEGTLLRAYLSHDGALMLADPVLSGNAACEPATTATWQDPKPAISHDQSPSDDS